MNEALDWCASVLGPFEVTSDHSKEHGGHESATRRLRTRLGYCYLKVHQSPFHWHNEVHAYKRWASSFGEFAPTLLAVREKTPLALIVSELPGQIVEDASLSPSQKRAIWRAAGAALVALDERAAGDCFGPCLHDGTNRQPCTQNAEEYVSERFSRQIERAIQGGYVDEDEINTLHKANRLIPAFAGEPPIPCHRDYCTANWLVSPEGEWAGVIDFEFAHWDVRVADFSRDPHWNWIHRPDLIAAFYAGYGRSLTPQEEQQLLMAHAEYALDAIIWGRVHAFHGFEQEGHVSLAHLAMFV